MFGIPDNIRCYKISFLIFQRQLHSRIPNQIQSISSISLTVCQATLEVSIAQSAGIQSPDCEVYTTHLITDTKSTNIIL